MNKQSVIDAYKVETVDWIPLNDLTMNGVPVTDSDDVEVSIVPELARPGSDGWAPATPSDGAIGFVLTGPTLGRGIFCVYVRPASDDSFKPVVPIGRIRLT